MSGTALVCVWKHFELLNSPAVDWQPVQGKQLKLQVVKGKMMTDCTHNINRSILRSCKTN